MPPLAAALAAFHGIAEPRTDHGGRPGMAWVIEGNAAGFAASRLYSPGSFVSGFPAQESAFQSASSHKRLQEHQPCSEFTPRTGL